MRVSLIVAMTRSGVIGRAGGLPWKLSTDLKRFKSLTMGHHLIMGRKTFESLGRVLPGRTSIVVTRRKDFQPPSGVAVAHSLKQALDLASHDSEVFIIGGGEIFAQAIGHAHRLYFTWVESPVEGDTFFSNWQAAAWQPTETQRHSADEKNEYDTTFCIYDRIQPASS